MATLMQNLRTLSRIQQARDMTTPPDRWEEERLREEAEEKEASEGRIGRVGEDEQG